MWEDLEQAAVKRERLAGKFNDRADMLEAVTNLVGTITRNRGNALADMLSEENLGGYSEGLKRYNIGKARMKAEFKRVKAMRRKARGLRISAFMYRAVAGLGRIRHP